MRYLFIIIILSTSLFADVRPMDRPWCTQLKIEEHATFTYSFYNGFISDWDSVQLQYNQIAGFLTWEDPSQFYPDGRYVGYKPQSDLFVFNQETKKFEFHSYLDFYNSSVSQIKLRLGDLFFDKHGRFLQPDSSGDICAVESITFLDLDIPIGDPVWLNQYNEWSWSNPYNERSVLNFPEWLVENGYPTEPLYWMYDLYGNYYWEYVEVEQDLELKRDLAHAVNMSGYRMFSDSSIPDINHDYTLNSYENIAVYYGELDSSFNFNAFARFIPSDTGLKFQVRVSGRSTSNSWGICTFNYICDIMPTIYYSIDEEQPGLGLVTSHNGQQIHGGLPQIPTPIEKDYEFKIPIGEIDYVAHFPIYTDENEPNPHVQKFRVAARLFLKVCCTLCFALAIKEKIASW